MSHTARYRIFLLSPAYAGGERARMILSNRAEFELARKLRDKRGAHRRGVHLSQWPLLSGQDRIRDYI
jgi:hypothetical protein